MKRGMSTLLTAFCVTLQFYWIPLPVPQTYAGPQSSAAPAPDLDDLTTRASVIFVGRPRMLFVSGQSHLIMSEVREVLKEKDANWRADPSLRVSFSNLVSVPIGSVWDRVGRGKEVIAFMEPYPGTNATWYVLGRDPYIGLVESTSNRILHIKSLVADSLAVRQTPIPASESGGATRRNSDRDKASISTSDKSISRDRSVLPCDSE